jgi:amidase
MTELAWMDATGQAELVRRGEASPAELTAAAIGRIEAVDPRLGALVRNRFERATAEAAGPLPDGPFRGVPFLLKDLGCAIAGEPCGFGLAAMQGVPQPVTSYLARAFTGAGFVVLGRTNVPELGTTVTTEPASLAPTRNPWDPARSAGGSSGGAGAAVASGMVPAAHGSDGGGSVRIPASACGLVGLKPTRGRVSHGPLAGEGWAGASTDGILTRTVRDAAAIADVMATTEVGEPHYAPPLPGSLAVVAATAPGRLRIGLLDRPDGDGYLDDPECRAAVAAAGQLLESLGHQVGESAPAAMFDSGLARNLGTLIAADTAHTLGIFETMLGRPLEDGDIEPRNAAYRHAGQALDAVSYLAARSGIMAWARRMADWWTGHDLLVTPVLGAPPPELGWFTAAGPQAEGRRIVSFIPYTSQFNLTGQPAISLPLHWTAAGLPVGVQLVAAFGREDLLIQVASQLEQAAPWADRRPPVRVTGRTALL